ncbi:type 2 isopentenyl-diphosphate Delta-isomerase [Bacillus sp. AGMB 02131]|uniref:Isopentenyl-diphosphate delta-isomerase n=1 Tax=Peribacillus faecalis TaxID=2772559 RepID=A0A927HDA5_9BACI|nr:type 2 isopentenyl-diphosphate Delta-isomerase [Peribacillus faecalis]MBD3110376.1 type 2 isopentenyl-diphosphate Delta-isomerase [Peribacillus faecalis]
MSRKKRKLEHIEYALKTGQSRATGLDDVAFVHVSLPEISLDEVRIDTQMGGLSLSSPIFINAMTGGGGEETENINRALSIASRETGIAMAVGSQMSAIRDERERQTYRVVRQENPNGVIFANVGSEATTDEAKRAIEMLEADALQIHINPIQELVMPEGDRDFSNTLHRIEEICQTVSVPVIAKEVGFGMSKETVTSLANIGVQMVDISGYGGTNFAMIENERRNRLLSFFNSWGISTAASIVEASKTPLMTILASGGIQNAMDVAKCLALGADAVGVAGYFLKVYKQHGLDHLINEINLVHDDLRIIMTALGVTKCSELQKVKKVISGDTYHWLSQRKLL